MDWLEDIGYGTVTGRFGGITGDGPDADRFPDTHSKRIGVVTFRPSASFVRYTGSGGNIMLSLEPYEATIDNEGYLCTKSESGLPGERGVILPASNSNVISPRNFTYSVTINIGGTNFANFNIRVNAGDELDLSSAIPVQSSSGNPVIVDNSSALEAASHANDAKTYSESAHVSMVSATEAAQNATTAAGAADTSATDASTSASSAADILTQTQALGLSVDTSVGTRVFVGDTMIHGDTGWRDVSDTVLVEVTDARLLIRRVGNIVYYSADTLQIVNDVPQVSGIVSIPAGFRPSRPFRAGPGATYELNAAIYSTTGGLELHTREGVQAGRRRFYVNWITDSSWPTSLPGTPW